MSYTAYICKVENLQKHPNAHSLQVATVMGYNVILGLDTKEGELGILFPDGGCITNEFGTINKLFRKHPETLVEMGGYLEPNGRIKTLKLRGAVSEALWLPLEALDKFAEAKGKRPVLPIEGDEITEWVGKVICGKHYSKATIQKMAKEPRKKGIRGYVGNKWRRLVHYLRGPSVKEQIEEVFDQHYETVQLRHTLGRLPEGLKVITEKLHGTSGRTKYCEVELPLAWYKRLVGIKPVKQYQLISGTRRCILNPGGHGEKGMNYRAEIHDWFNCPVNCVPLIDRDEAWYYEIVGYADGGAPIMPRHTVGSIGDSKLEKQLAKQYGKEPFVYSYGCEPEESVVALNRLYTVPYRVFVYRIVRAGKELTYSEIVARVKEINERSHDEDGYRTANFEIVPKLMETHSSENLIKYIEELTEGQPSTLDKRHPMEGACIRVETETGVSRAYKQKTFVFRALEGLACTEDVVDTEDAS